MLDNKALNQLTQLKSDILASKEFANGTVVGTNGRYGFVRTEDGRDAYLSPEKMEKLLPGDSVKISIVTNKQDKLEATLEELIESPTSRFLGTYHSKGKAHFVAPDIVGFNRWIFVPPQFRAKCKEGDLVAAEIIRHPLEDGKAQAKVLERIGRPDDDKIEFKHVKAKYDLSKDFTQKEINQVKNAEKVLSEELNGERQDWTHIPFVTIDSSSTRDMDDAIAVEKVDGNDTIAYKLYVAIADPTAAINQGSPLARAAQARAQTVYMLGGAVPMLPTSLSNQFLSLEENKKKLSLCCEIEISHSGEILSSKFSYGIIESKFKLSYEDVASYLEQENIEAIPESTHDLIKDLFDMAKARIGYRQTHNIVGQDQVDFDYQLNIAGKIESIRAKPKNDAHRIVEEAMVATNICAGELLAEHKIGIATVNEGFRKERIGEVKALLKEEEIKTEENIETLEGFKELLNKLSSETPEKAYIIHPLRRMMQFGHPSLTHAPHANMGLAHYATISSPIRRFVDLYNHWAMKHILLGQPLKAISEKHVEQLNENLQKGKQAERELFQWLITQHVQNLIGTEAHGKIRIITQQGFGVRIDENGIEGFVLFPKKQEKKYDAKRMTLTVGETTYKLDQTVKVKIASVDLDKRRVAFEILEDSQPG